MKEDQLLDEIKNPLEIGNLAAINHYNISKTDDGTLKIKLAGSRKKFFLIAISISVILIFFLILLLIDAKDDFLAGLLAILCIVGISILLLRISFALFKQIAWHFTESELIIFNNLRRKKNIPRSEIEAVIVYHATMGWNEEAFDQNIWIILQTDKQKYEDGKLHLIKIEGDSSRKNLSLRYETEDIQDPFVETCLIAAIISNHWNIPIREDES